MIFLNAKQIHYQKSKYYQLFNKSIISIFLAILSFSNKKVKRRLRKQPMKITNHKMILKSQNLKINSQIIFTLRFLKTSKTLFQKIIPLQKVLSHQKGNKSKNHKQIHYQSLSYQTTIPTFHRQKIAKQPQIYNLLRNFAIFRNSINTISGRNQY